MLSFKSRALKSTIKYSIKRLNQRPKKKTFRWKNFLIETKLKLKQNRLSLMVSFLFWFSGFMYYFFVEPCPPTASSPLSCYFHTFFVSLTIRNPTVQSDWSRFYDLVWPIFLEVFFDFILKDFKLISLIYFFEMNQFFKKNNQRKLYSKSKKSYSMKILTN